MNMLPAGAMIEPVCCDYEINYNVYVASHYLCRLVPDSPSFALSKLDKAIGNIVDEKLVMIISDYITQQEL